MPNQTEISVAGKPVYIFPSAGSSDIVYLHGRAESAECLALVPEAVRPSLVLIDGTFWEHDLSPWCAKGVFRDGGDFTGGAPEYLPKLTDEIIPAAEAALGPAKPRRMIAGYSLAGLFAVWCLYNTDVFSRAACMSGSLWFDGFTDYMANNRMLSVPDRIYFSLGGKEKNSREPRMARVEDCTREALQIVRRLGIETKFVNESGGHFADVPGRIARGIEYICK